MLSGSRRLALQPVGCGSKADNCGGKQADGCSDSKSTGTSEYGRPQPHTTIPEALCSWRLGRNGSAKSSYNNPLHRPGVGGRMVSDRRTRPSPYRVLRRDTEGTASSLIDKNIPFYGLQVAGDSEDADKLPSCSDATHRDPEEGEMPVTWWPLCIACLFVATVATLLLLVLFFPPEFVNDANGKVKGLDVGAAEDGVAESPGLDR